LGPNDAGVHRDMGDPVPVRGEVSELGDRRLLGVGEPLRNEEIGAQTERICVPSGLVDRRPRGWRRRSDPIDREARHRMDESRVQRQSRTIDLLGTFDRDRRSDIGDDAILDQHVGLFDHVARTVHDPNVVDEDRLGSLGGDKNRHDKQHASHLRHEVPGLL